MNKEFNKKSLTKVQRLVELGTTAAIRSPLYVVLAAMLNLHSFGLFKKLQVAKRALRLRDSKLWKQMECGHNRM